jgi:putative tryptophan/tyrosine transport system substrate-binding protein
MKRRTLGQVLVWPWLAAAVLARAQTAPVLRVAWVSLEQANSNPPVLAAFRAGLAGLGYVEGKNLQIDSWWGNGSAARLEQLRGEILGSRPDLIVAQGGLALMPMLNAEVNRPVLFSMSGDPAAARIVASYAHPGGNATGITLFAAELAGKRLALLKEVLPGMRSVAVIHNPLHPGAPREVASTRQAAEALALKPSFLPTRNAAELDAALAEAARLRVDAVLVFADGFTLTHSERIAEFSLRQRIPVVAGWASFAQRGNLMAYGPEFEDVYRRLASYADRIRKGAKAADLPVEQPSKFELVVNLKTARALGLTVPRTVLLQATEVIE